MSSLIDHVVSLLIGVVVVYIIEAVKDWRQVDKAKKRLREECDYNLNRINHLLTLNPIFTASIVSGDLKTFRGFFPVGNLMYSAATHLAQSGQLSDYIGTINHGLLANIENFFNRSTELWLTQQLQQLKTNNDTATATSLNLDLQTRFIAVKTDLENILKQLT